MTSVDTFLGLTSLGAKPDMEQVNNAIKMNDPFEVVRLFSEANGMGREDFCASLVAPYEYTCFVSGTAIPEEVLSEVVEKVKEIFMTENLDEDKEANFDQRVSEYMSNVASHAKKKPPASKKGSAGDEDDGATSPTYNGGITVKLSNGKIVTDVAAFRQRKEQLFTGTHADGGRKLDEHGRQIVANTTDHVHKFNLVVDTALKIFAQQNPKARDALNACGLMSSKQKLAQGTDFEQFLGTHNPARIKLTAVESSLSSSFEAEEHAAAVTASISTIPDYSNYGDPTVLIKTELNRISAQQRRTVGKDFTRREKAVAFYGALIRSPVKNIKAAGVICRTAFKNSFTSSGKLKQGMEFPDVEVLQHLAQTSDELANYVPEPKSKSKAPKPEAKPKEGGIDEISNAGMGEDSDGEDDARRGRGPRSGSRPRSRAPQGRKLPQSPRRYDDSNMVCYQCGKTGHRKMDCPNSPLNAKEQDKLRRKLRGELAKANIAVKVLKEALRSSPKPHQPPRQPRGGAAEEENELDTETSESGEEEHGDVRFGFFGDTDEEEVGTELSTYDTEYLNMVAEAEATERATELLKHLPKITTKAEKKKFIACHVRHELEKKDKKAPKEKGGRGGRAGTGARPPRSGGFA